MTLTTRTRTTRTTTVIEQQEQQEQEEEQQEEEQQQQEQEEEQQQEQQEHVSISTAILEIRDRREPAVPTYAMLSCACCCADYWVSCCLKDVISCQLQGHSQQNSCYMSRRKGSNSVAIVLAVAFDACYVRCICCWCVVSAGSYQNSFCESCFEVLPLPTALVKLLIVEQRPSTIMSNGRVNDTTRHHQQQL